MPDNEGKLTADERAKVIAWLNRFPNSQNARCPICGSQEWMLAEYLVQPITMGPNGALHLGGIGYPQVVLISNPCGYTRFLNAVIVGLLPGSRPEEEQANK